MSSGWKIEIKIWTPAGELMQNCFLGDRLSLVLKALKTWLDELGPY